jgi:hypothetical protein
VVHWLHQHLHLLLRHCLVGYWLGLACKACKGIKVV